MFKGFFNLFFNFLAVDFLQSSGEHIFGSIAFFAPNGMFQRGLIS